MSTSTKTRRERTREPTPREKLLRRADQEAAEGREVRLKESTQTGELMLFVVRRFTESDFR